MRTIDRDNHMDLRPPFESVMSFDGQVASDIQAFGYNQDDPKQSTAQTERFWCLLRQDLYLNNQPTAFLIVHWKHSVNFIGLVDVIPGERTQSIAND